MANKVIITCPFYSEGSGGVATFYKVFAEKQKQNARLFYIGKDKPKNWIKALCQLIGQYIHLTVLLPKYELLVVNPSLKPNAIRRDSLSIRIAKLLGKKTCVFWRGFNDDYFNTVIKSHKAHLLQHSLFDVDYTIVLGRSVYDKYHSIGLNTPYSLGSTMLDSSLLRPTPKWFPKGRFRILFLARIIKEKGIFEALEAFKIFHAAHLETDFLIVGDGDDLAGAKSYVISQNIHGITFIGDARGEQKRKCFEDSDVYLFPSYTEGMPNSVLEAMGMGLPIISSNVGAIPDFFTDELMGVLMTGHTSNEILAALERLYADRNRFFEISEYNRKYAAKHFVDNIVIENLENLFANI